MAYLDGDIVEVGDRVHHITLGAGKVESVNGTEVRVRMNRGGGVFNMNGNGLVRGTKVFYWSDPVLLVPRKNQKAVITEAMQLLDNSLVLAQERLERLGGGNESD